MASSEFGASALPIARLAGALGISQAGRVPARDLIRSSKTAKAAERRAKRHPAPSQAKPAAAQALARLRAVC
jgi:hypothetical protein